MNNYQQPDITVLMEGTEAYPAIDSD